MPKVTRTTVAADLTVHMELTEAEVRALDAIFGYDVKHFLQVFYERMGEAYVKPHEAGVRSLHSSIRTILAGPIAAINKARNAMNEALRNQS